MFQHLLSPNSDQRYVFVNSDSDVHPHDAKERILVYTPEMAQKPQPIQVDSTGTTRFKYYKYKLEQGRPT